MAAAKGSRFEAHDRCLLLMMFRHGLRVSKTADSSSLTKVDTESLVLHIARLKKELSTKQPLRAEELRVIKAWPAGRATLRPTGKTFFIILHLRPLNRRTAFTIRRYGDPRGLPYPPTPVPARLGSPWLTKARTRG